MLTMFSYNEQDKFNVPIKPTRKRIATNKDQLWNIQIFGTSLFLCYGFRNILNLSFNNRNVRR